MTEILNIAVGGERAEVIAKGFRLARRLREFGIDTAFCIPGSSARLVSVLLGESGADVDTRHNRHPSVRVDGVRLLSVDELNGATGHDVVVHTLDPTHHDWPERERFSGDIWLLVEPREEAVTPAWMVLNELMSADFSGTVRVVMNGCCSASEARSAFRVMVEALDRDDPSRLVLVGSIIDDRLPESANGERDGSPAPLTVILQPSGEPDRAALVLAAMGNFVPECVADEPVDLAETVQAILEPFDYETFEVGYHPDTLAVHLVSRNASSSLACAWHDLGSSQTPVLS